MLMAGRCVNSPDRDQLPGRGIGMAKATCCIAGCDRPHNARGLCGLHYREAERYGVLHQYAPIQDGTRIVQGYITVRAPTHPLAGKNGYVREHRKVVFDAGIPITPADDVHHINGDKADNRLENLEVLPRGEHSRRHLEADGWVSNQFGRFQLRRFRSTEEAAE